MQNHKDILILDKLIYKFKGITIKMPAQFLMTIAKGF